MKVGLFCLATDEMMPFDRVAQQAESRGFDSLFTGEHDHIPVGAQLWSGGDLPELYRHLLDPFLALTSAAAATQRIKVGTSICLVALHDPIRLAKSVATLDFLSGGRFVFGIGHGYIEKEIANHGIDPKFRRGILREKMLAVETIWSNPVATYNGKYVSFEDCVQYPKPMQVPRPPVLLGAMLRKQTMDYIVEFCDGWIPTAMMAGDSLGSDIVSLRRHAEEAGRDPATIEVTVFHATTNADQRATDWGADIPTEEDIARYEAMGVSTLCLSLPSKDETVIVPLLDRYVEVVGHLLGSVPA